MSVYPKSIAALLESVRCAGESGSESSSGRAVRFECGGFVRVSLQIDKTAGAVVDARFGTSGCGYMAAAAEAACRRLVGKPLADLNGLESVEKALAAVLGSIPANRSGCVSAMMIALRDAFNEHRERRVEEFAGERALICTCFGISEDTVTACIESIDPESVDQVSSACRAGSGCGACRMLIQELIDVRSGA